MSEQSQDVAPAGQAPRAVDQAALVALVAAEFLVWLFPLAMLAWIAGVVLLTVSKFWAISDRSQAWLWLGSGLPVGMLTEILARPAQDLPVWALALIVLAVLAYFWMQIKVVVRLLKVRR